MHRSITFGDEDIVLLRMRPVAFHCDDQFIVYFVTNGSYQSLYFLQSPNRPLPSAIEPPAFTKFIEPHEYIHKDMKNSILNQPRYLLLASNEAQADR